MHLLRISIALGISLISMSIIIAQNGPPRVRIKKDEGPPAIPILYRPGDSVQHAYLNIKPLVDQLQSHETLSDWRYLSLYNIPESKRVNTIKTLNFVINSLSRARNMSGVLVVANTRNTLVKINMANYRFFDSKLNKQVGWHPQKSWDVIAQNDPYFYATVVESETVITKNHNVQYGERLVHIGNGVYRKERYPLTNKNFNTATKTRIVKNKDVWCDPAAMSYLRQYLCTDYPIMRADYFIANATLPPHYYNFLEFGGKTEDFFDAIFLDINVVKRAKLDIKGIVVRSGSLLPNVIPVANFQRTLTRNNAPYGYMWQTRDVSKVSDTNDYLRRLVDDDFEASEYIASGRNGLQWYFLSNSDNVRQDEAPTTIAIDRTNDDKRVRNGRSCITCHPRGINEFVPLPQELVKHRIDIISPATKFGYERAIHLKETYIDNTSEIVSKDNAFYNAAVQACTGWTAEENTRFYSTAYSTYADTNIDLEMAQFELGVPIKYLPQILANAQNDPYLLGLSRGQKLFSVPRVHWERSFQEAMIRSTQYAGVRR